jgi:hypothetical protein
MEEECSSMFSVVEAEMEGIHKQELRKRAEM